MMDLSLYISKLLFDNSRVEIPGLGIFESKIIDAYHHPVSHEFTPKSRKISFAKDTNAKDSTLVNYLNAEDGEQLITSFVNEVNKSLEENKEFYFKNIGWLKVHSTGSLVFEQEEDFNYEKSFFGLETFSQEPIKIKEEVKTKALPMLEATPESVRSMTWIWWLVGVSVAASIVVTIIMNWELISKPEPKQIAQQESVQETNPIEENESADIEGESTNKESQAVVVEGYTDSIESDTMVAEELAEVESIEESEPEQVQEEIPIVVEPTQGNKKYYVIAGCFRSNNKAQDYLSGIKDKGYSDASIEGKTPKGLIRVCYGGFETRAQAKVFLNEVSEKENKNLWIQKIND